MNQKDFIALVEPLCQLTGYCRSAVALRHDSNIIGWSNRLIELADKLDKAWNETAINLPGDQG